MSVDDPLVVQVLREFRAGLVSREANQRRTMLSRWNGIEERLTGLSSSLANEAARMRAEGQPVNVSTVMRLERYRALMAQTRVEINRYTAWAEDDITGQQTDYARLGAEASLEAIGAVYRGNGEVVGAFDLLPSDAIEAMVGLTGRGSPLRDLLRLAWPDAAGGMIEELINATALGQNPRLTARAMYRGMARGLNRLMTIARTEQLRAYRSAAREQMKASGVVKGYRRIAARDYRVCPACLFDDGKFYKLSAEMPEHPNGRCSMVPVVEGMPEIRWQNGQRWFNLQSAQAQRQILGTGRYDLWRSGQIDLSDIIQIRTNRLWGKSLQTASLKYLTR